jgi:hypothetical protein
MPGPCATFCLAPALGREGVSGEEPQTTLLPFDGFLIGRSLANNVVNLLFSPLTDQFIQEKLNLIGTLEQRQKRMYTVSDESYAHG